MPITIKKPKLNLAPAPEPEFVSAFDYGSIDPTAAADAKAAASRIRSRITGIKTSIIDIGKDLLSVKETLAHGEFGAWLDAEFGMSDRTARRYMLAAETLGSISDTVSDLPVKVLHALAAPSTPPEVKEAVLAEIEAGETPTPASVAAKVKAAKVSSSGSSKKKVDPEMGKTSAAIAFDYLQKALSKNKLHEFAVTFEMCTPDHFALLVEAYLCGEYP